jgi:hypothetical protein
VTALGGNSTQWNAKQDSIRGNEAVFNGWDKNVSDDFSGDYNDLLNKPTIPTVNDSTITLQRNGASIGNFTLNQAANEIFNFIDENTQLSDGEIGAFGYIKDGNTNWNNTYGLWGKGTDIPSSADLNTYTTDGYYHQNSTNSASTGINYPTPLAGMLRVYSDGVMIYQEYHTFNGSGKYIRTYYNEMWYDWDKVFDTGNFTDNSTDWNDAYNNKITSVGVTGTTTKTITLNQQDGGTVTANFTDNNTTNLGKSTTSGMTSITSSTGSNTQLFWTGTASEYQAIVTAGQIVTGVIYLVED